MNIAPLHTYGRSCCLDSNYSPRSDRRRCGFTPSSRPGSLISGPHASVL